jgi:short-subunit dehydrogenase involved in D-alanine esterification of teichoic acids
MNLEIAGLRVLVTAGAAGIGLKIARTFLRVGALVHVCDIDRTALKNLPATDPRITHSGNSIVQVLSSPSVLMDVLRLRDDGKLELN